MSDAGVIRLTRDQVARLRTGATMVLTGPAVFRIEGLGAVDCVQGLLTCDVVRPGPDSVTYGALLTPKGMIVVDFWALRDGSAFTMIAPREGHAAALDLFRRQLPPRLARMTDRSGEWLALWLLGTGVETVVRDAALPWPNPGHLVPVPAIPGPVVVARPEGLAPWDALIIAPRETMGGLTERLAEAGAKRGVTDQLDAARVLAGWPALGQEIDDRTLPQEVRYDEIGGVSYTKGCYVGQETVARVHFRGHPNRVLRGLGWEGDAPADRTILAAEKEVGQLRTVLVVEDRSYGLALLRREVEPGAEVTVGGQPARVLELPLAVGE